MIPQEQRHDLKCGGFLGRVSAAMLGRITGMDRFATYSFANKIVCKVSSQHIHRECLAHFVGVHLEPGQNGHLKKVKSLTSKVAMTPSAILKDMETLTNASNNGSLSSCKSLLYVEGRPFNVMTKPAI